VLVINYRCVVCIGVAMQCGCCFMYSSGLLFRAGWCFSAGIILRRFNLFFIF
jgi:hypothetical protein